MLFSGSNRHYWTRPWHHPCEHGWEGLVLMYCWPSLGSSAASYCNSDILSTRHVSNTSMGAMLRISASSQEEICIGLIWKLWSMYGMLTACCGCYLFLSFSSCCAIWWEILFVELSHWLWSEDMDIWKHNLDGNFYLRTLCIWHMVCPVLLLSQTPYLLPRKIQNALPFYTSLPSVIEKIPMYGCL